MVKVFVSYSHRDENLRAVLETHLALLKNQGVLQVWHDRQIRAGEEFDASINQQIDEADIILLLISPDFIASSYCWSVELKRAMERHDAKSTRVIPIILRACDWHSASFGKLLAAPKDGKPVRLWSDLDEAFLDVAKHIRSVAEAIIAKSSILAPSISSPAPAPKNRNVILDGTHRVYCSRCGASTGTRSTCTGSYTHHLFTASGTSGFYCARCGVLAGTRSVCTGSYTHHVFRSLPSAGVYCIRCGVTAGERSTCTGSYTHHDFCDHSLA